MEIAPGVGMVTGADGGGLVTVHGLATFAWDGGGEAGRRLAAVQLVRLRAASQSQVAAAFGADPAMCGGGIRPWSARVAALVPSRRGPKGESKLTVQLAARIAELDAGGKTLRQISAAIGVSTFSVRSALGRVAAREHAPRRTNALAALCDQLDQARARYPGTDLILRYEAKPTQALHDPSLCQES